MNDNMITSPHHLVSVVEDSQSHTHTRTQVKGKTERGGGVKGDEAQATTGSSRYSSALSASSSSSIVLSSAASTTIIWWMMVDGCGALRRPRNPAAAARLDLTCCGFFHTEFSLHELARRMCVYICVVFGCVCVYITLLAHCCCLEWLRVACFVVVLWCVYTNAPSVCECVRVCYEEHTGKQLHDTVYGARVREEGIFVYIKCVNKIGVFVSVCVCVLIPNKYTGEKGTHALLYWYRYGAEQDRNIACA